jgi:hypothetical protein
MASALAANDLFIVDEGEQMRDALAIIFHVRQLSCQWL